MATKHIDDSIKVVLFDHDDTLVGTIKPKWAEHKFIAKTYYGKKLANDEIAKHWGKPLIELMSLLYETADTDRALKLNTKHHKEYPKLLFDQTIATLKAIKAMGLKVGIVTATHRFSYDYDLKFHKFPKGLVDFSQTSNEVEFHKPDPRVFEPALAWLKTINVKPSEVLYVGDGLHDMKAAKGAGFRFLGVETGLISSKQFKKAGAKSITNIGKLL